MIKIKRSYFEVAAYVVLVLIIAMVFFFEYNGIVKVFSGLTKALGPFVVGFTIAYILNRPLRWLESKLHLPRYIAVPLLYICILAVITGFIYYYLPQVLENSNAVVSALSKSQSDFVVWVNSTELLEPIVQYLQQDFGGLASFVSGVVNSFIAQVSTFFLDLTAVFLNLFFGTIISLYMLFGKESQIGTLKKILKTIFKDKAERHLAFLGEVNLVFSQFISGLIVEAFIVGVLAYIIFISIGVEYSLILALIIMCANVVPYLGPIVSAIPAVLTTLTYDPVKAFWVGVLLLILQQFDGNYIGPKVMGNFIGMQPIWVIFAISIGAGVGGVTGILLAIPVAAVIKIVWNKTIEQKNQ